MRCTSVLKRLPLFAGGDLASPQCEQIERHLASCFACARAYAQTVAARDALHQLGARSREPGPWEETSDVLASRGGDDTFFTRMREEIVSEAFTTVGADGRHGGGALVPRRRVWFGSGFLAAGLVFLAMGFVLGLFQRPGAGSAWDAGAVEPLDPGLIRPVGDVGTRLPPRTQPVSRGDKAVTDQVVPIDGYPVPREEWTGCGQDDPDFEAELRRERRAGDHRPDPIPTLEKRDGSVPQPTVLPTTRPRRGI